MADLTGRFDREETKISRPIEANEALERLASIWLQSKVAYHAHKDIPREAKELARWWVRHQEQPKEPRERPTKHSRRDGKGEYWKTPYIDRLVSTLLTFLYLDPEFQGLIIAAAEDGIYWRGDDRKTFMLVITEHDKMNKIGINAYREHAISEMRKTLAQFGAG